MHVEDDHPQAVTGKLASFSVASMIDRTVFTQGTKIHDRKEGKLLYPAGQKLSNELRRVPGASTE